MSSSDVTPVIARIKNRIETVSNVGPVYDHDIYARDDLADLIVSSISGTPTLRAWWISGPKMDAKLVEQRPAGYQHRWWTYTITGIDGIPAGHDGITTLRGLAVSVADALDADRQLNGTCHRTWPTTWPDGPSYRVIAGVHAAVAWVQLEKRALTLSTP
jgi:hypothetical protein